LAELAALADAAFQIDQARAAGIDARIACRHALHAGLCIAVTARARFRFAPRGFLPQRFTARGPQHAGIGEIVVLQFAHFSAGKFEPRLERLRLRRRALRMTGAGQREQ